MFKIKVNNWLNIIQENWLPPRCLLCGKPGFAGLDLCPACLDDFSKNQPACYRCGMFLEGGEPLKACMPTPQLCGHCLTHTPSFDQTHAPYRYDDYLRFLVTHLKYHQRYPHARLLGQLLTLHLQETADMPDCIVPVPLHTGRYRARGFNQSIEIARPIAKALSIPLDLSSCVRNRDTGHQTELTAKQRRHNMKNAFTVASPLPYAHVAIVDDVMTTGATVEALANALKRQGASRVDAWVCARA